MSWGKKSEKKPPDKELLFRTITENALVGAYIFQDDRLIYVNPAMAEIFGYKREEIIGKLSLLDLAHPEDKPLVAIYSLRHIKGAAESIHYTFKGIRKNKEVIHCELLGRRLDYRGKPAIVGTLIDITERTKAEEALRRSEERYHTLIDIVDTSDIGIFILDENFTVVWMNQALEEFFGLCRDDVIGMNKKELIQKKIKYIFENPEEFATRVLATYEDNTYIENFECHVLAGEGRKERWLEYWSKPIRFGIYAGGRIEQYHDITQRKKMEEALKESEKKYRELINTSVEGVVSVDPSMKIILWNPGAERIFGYTYEEMLEENILKIIPERYKEAIIRNFSEFRETGKGPYIGKTFELEGLTKDGREIPIEISLSSRKSKNIYIATAIMRDITKRKKIEEALQESEQKYRTLVENSLTGIFIYQDGKYIFVNNRFAEMHGYEVEELIGKDHLILIHPEEREIIRQIISEMMKKSNISRRYDVKRLTKDGKMIWCEMNLTRIEYGGKPAILGNVVDITERRRLQEQLLHSQKMEAIGRLAGGIAHDFNNLLTAIMGYSDILSVKLSQHPSFLREVEEIKKAAERAASLTRQLLAFSRRQMLQEKVLDLNVLVKDLEKMLRRIIGEDIELITILDSDLYPVKVDPSQIEQVILNLAVNARDAMPDGGKLTLKTENVYIDEDYCEAHPYAQCGRFVCLSVSDTGIGMDNETIQHIFEPFFTTKRTGTGTGLGLSVVYGIVKQHGGWINVHSIPNKGSTFMIYFPAFSEVSEEEVCIEPPSLRLKGKGEGILLVEDEEEVRKFIATALRENGYYVFEARNSKEAKDIFEKEKKRINLIFTDVVLPDKSGILLVEELISEKPDIKVLLTSGYTDQKSQLNIIEQKGFKFLQKPYTLKCLLQTVKDSLS